MRVAFVTPRYGTEIMGGAETGARQLAEHLVADLSWECEVFTTAALDYVTWEDAFDPGDSELHGVVVHRFASAAGRSPRFYALDGRLRLAPGSATRREAAEWVESNGPVNPELLEAARASRADVMAFYPYLYYPSVHGIGQVPMPTVLHPAAHDEHALYLPIYRGTFQAADGIAYHTEAERRLVQRVHKVAEHPQIVLGLGVGSPKGRGRRGGEVLGIGERPYLVSLGRVDTHKGSSMLARFFLRFKERHPGPLALAFVGPVAADIPEHPDLVVTGVVDEADKWDLLADSLVSVSPSAMESFSLVVMESWTKGVPVLVNALCDPTREHCQRSGGGLWFDSYRSFEVALERLVADGGLRQRLGQAGRSYVDSRYAWPVLIDRYARFLEEVAAAGRRFPTVL